MTAGQYFDSVFKETELPCFVAELKSNIVISVNKAFEDLLLVKQELVGKSFENIVTNNSEKCTYLFNDSWDYDDIKKTDIFVEFTGKRYDIINIKVDFSGTSYNLCKFLQKDNTINQSLTFEEAMTHCINIFHQPQETVVSLMELLARFYGADRAYVYRVDPQISTIHCTAQWCVDPEFHVTQEIESKIDTSVWLPWVKSKQYAGIIQIDPSKTHYEDDSEEMQLLKAFHMKNCVLGFLEDEHENVIGMVGFSNYTTAKLDFRLLRAMVRFVIQNLNQEPIESTMALLNIDPLTGVSSRSVYSECIEQISCSPPKSLGVLAININGLKQVNERLGINEGDNYIKKIAKQLQNHFCYEFYRLSGDEFVGLAPDVSKEELEEKVYSLHNSMKEEGKYNFAFGHAWSNGKFDYALMLHEAETMMYINKQEYYHLSQRHFSTVNNKLLSDLLTYLENDEFMIYLQPQVNLKDASLYGAEALIRRFDKTNQKMVFPDQFISLYEQNSVIRHVDIFVVETVCKLLQEWSKVGKSLPISVNLSRVTLQEYGIVDTIINICDEYQVPHHLLVIEVTERVGLIENNVASSLVQDFKKNGFNISLDDFGCAYSNIVTLSQIVVDEVKIDKSLIDNLTTDQKNHILVKNVLTMCNELEGASTLAEGIENEEQAKSLLDLGCHLGQGYFYSRPIPVEEFSQKYLFT
ncbi:MAG: bifunctional diguanylate cyclase/phosphodiesterase [Eubacteriales bacterium]